MGRKMYSLRDQHGNLRDEKGELVRDEFSILQDKYSALRDQHENLKKMMKSRDGAGGGGVSRSRTAGGLGD